MRYLFFLTFLLGQLITSFAQEKTLSLNVKNTPIVSILNEIESSFDVRFSYSDKSVSNEKISIEFQNNTIDQIVKFLNKKSNLFFEFISEKNIVVLTKKDKFHVNDTQILNEIIVKNYITEGIHKQTDGSYTLFPKKLKILPGITEPDLFQTIQLLPGVISLEETSTDIHVRGGSSDQNLVLWDGIKIYHSGHLFGTFSAFNPYITNKISFINKGTNTKYGDRISSVIDIQTNNKVAKKSSGGIGFNLIEADAFVEIPVIKNKLSVLVSARRSFTDFILSNTYLKLSEKVFQNETTNSILKGDRNFYFFDYSLKANWKISDNDLVNFSYLNIENELETNYNDQKKNILFKDKLETENKGYNLSWKKNWNTRIDHQINAYYSNYGLLLNESIVQDHISDISAVRTNRVNDAGINFNLNYKLRSDQNISAGYQFSNNHIKYMLNNNTKKDPVSSDRTLNSHAVYTSYHYNNPKLFNLTGGLRLNYYSSLQKFELEPRLNIHKNLSHHLNINFTAERKTQAVSQINETINSGLSLENQIWTIANPPQIPIIESQQISAGLTYSINNWTLEIDTYYKEIEGLTTLNKGFIDIEDFTFSQGESTVLGLDLHAKKRFKNYLTWASYTYNKIKNHFEDINENESFSANTDIPHNLYWSHEYNYNNFQFALGWRWHSGKPYSKAIAVKEDSSGNSFLIYDGINNYRLPNYNRLDFSTTYHLKISNTFNGKIGVSILNMLDTENILNRKYGINDTDGSINTIETKSHQRVFNLVFRLFW